MKLEAILAGWSYLVLNVVSSYLLFISFSPSILKIPILILVLLPP